MALDGDLVRVDLLKVKRMMYKSFSEGSIEQKNFLISSKRSELNYLSSLVSPEVVELILGEYKKTLKFELINIAVCLIIGLCLSVTLFGYHQVHPSIIWFKFFKWPFGFGLYFSLKHIRHIVVEWKKMKPFKREMAELQRKTDKLNEELRNIK